MGRMKDCTLTFVGIAHSYLLSSLSGANLKLEDMALATNVGPSFSAAGKMFCFSCNMSANEQVQRFLQSRAAAQGAQASPSTVALNSANDQARARSIYFIDELAISYCSIASASSCDALFRRLRGTWLESLGMPCLQRPRTAQPREIP